MASRPIIRTCPGYLLLAISSIAVIIGIVARPFVSPWNEAVREKKSEKNKRKNKKKGKLKRIA